MRHSTILDKIFFVIAVIMCLIAARACAQESHFSIGLGAGTTTWTTGFDDLQTPGWPEHLGGHVVGAVEVQYKFKGTGIFAEVVGDPHRSRENRSFSIGLRHDLYSVKRVHLYGQVSVGVLEAPSFNEYCWSYEYMNGDCQAGQKWPEFCDWASANLGVGVRVTLNKRFDLEPARAEYRAVYGIGPRYTFLTGFRVKL